MTATLIDGKALAARLAREVAEEVESLGGVGLTTVLVGDDPASQIYIRLKHEAAPRPGSAPTTCASPPPISEQELLETRRRAERRRRASTRCSCSCRFPTASTRPRSSAAIDPRQGRRRLASAQRGRARTSAGRGSCPRRPRGVMAHARRVRRRARGRARRGRRPQRDRRQAGRASCSSRRTRP